VTCERRQIELFIKLSVRLVWNFIYSSLCLVLLVLFGLLIACSCSVMLNESYCHAVVLRAMPTGIAHSMLAQGQQPIAIRSEICCSIPYSSCFVHGHCSSGCSAIAGCLYTGSQALEESDPLRSLATSEAQRVVCFWTIFATAAYQGPDSRARKSSRCSCAATMVSTTLI